MTLKTLIGGYAGLPQKTNLYFDYSTSFELFLVMLGDATQRSVIPPKDFDQRSPAKRDSSIEIEPDTTSQTATSQTATSQHEWQQSFNSQESKQGGPDSRVSRSPSYNSSSRSGSISQAQARNINDRGYTLADGPWLYRFTREPPMEMGTAYVQVKDDLSYRKMVDNFIEIERKDPENSWTISLIHVSLRRYSYVRKHINFTSTVHG